MQSLNIGQILEEHRADCTFYRSRLRCVWFSACGELQRPASLKLEVCTPHTHQTPNPTIYFRNLGLGREQEHDEQLWLTALHRDTLVRVPLPQTTWFIVVAQRTSGNWGNEVRQFSTFPPPFQRQLGRVMDRPRLAEQCMLREKRAADASVRHFDLNSNFPVPTRQLFMPD